MSGQGVSGHDMSGDYGADGPAEAAPAEAPADRSAAPDAAPATVALPRAPLSATVVITTKNRAGELAASIESALVQTARPDVLIIDDGSTDGTADMVRAKFPGVRLDRVERSLGLIVQRNRAAALAATDVIFSIDDDAAFSTPLVVAQTLAEFDRPRVGAVAIPVIDVKRGPEIHQRAPDARGVYATFSYVGTAHALRREVFLQLGGYREFLFHQGEEGDFCVRMLDAGYVVRMGRADPIHHYESPRRDFRRMDLYGHRNLVLYAWYNVPMPYLPLQMLGATLKSLRHGFKVGRPWRTAQGAAKGYLTIPREWGKRRPVRRETYALSRLLKTREAAPLEEIEPLLPPLREAADGFVS